MTEQRAAQEARLDAAIAQREMLVKEVHHRIKNNLQGVAGLMQQIAQRRPEVAPVIAEVVGQVQAIAQVYGLQVGAVGPLRAKNVVEAIAGSVQRTFGRTIRFAVEGPTPHVWALPEAESIPIALTINELLTNAVKHSADGQRGRLHARLRRRGGADRDRQPRHLAAGLQPGARSRAGSPGWAWCARCCRGAVPAWTSSSAATGSSRPSRCSRRA